MTLIRLAYRSLLTQRRVLARPRCIRASGHDTRRDTVLQSSAATLAESSAPTAVRTEFASQRSSLLQTSGCRGRHMVGINYAGNGSCSGAARRAEDAFEALPRLLQQHAAHAVLEAPLFKHSILEPFLNVESNRHGRKNSTRPTRSRVLSLRGHQRTVAASATASGFAENPRCSLSGPNPLCL